VENIKLSVTRKFIDLPSESIQKKTIKEQDSKCAFCNIDIKKHAKIHSEKENDYKALCTICYHSQHIEILNGETDGTIIMLGDLSQLELIILSRTIEMIKRLDPEEFAEDIDSSIVIRMLLEEGSNNAETYFAEGSSDIELVAQALSNQTDSEYEKREDGLYTMKWLPNYDSFKTELDYWFETLMKDESSLYNPSKWESMMQKMKQKKKQKKKG